MSVQEQLQRDADAVRYGLVASELIRDAVEVNHKQVGSAATLRDYEKDLEHFVDYLDSHGQRTPYTAQRKHVAKFLNHLAAHGGVSPDASRLACSWCRERAYPDGVSGCGNWGRFRIAEPH